MTRQTVVITGASAGVGRAVAWLFARQGARIALLARGRAGLEGVQREVESLGGEALTIPADVASAEQVESAAETIESQLGPIDVWINNAMASVFSRAAEMPADEHRRVMEVSYLGYVHGTLSALRRMQPRDRGAIVQVGSALAYRGIPLQSAYCAAKHAVQGFTESVRCELMHDGSQVRISMVQLPALNTPQFEWVRSRMPRRPQPVPPIFQPEVAAEAIALAARQYRREWWVGGSTVTAVLGNKLAPNLADRYLARTGFDSQQYDGKIDANRPDNLFRPVDDDRDFGAHGEFDARARGQSWQFWANKHRRWLAVAAGVVGALAAAGAGGWLSPTRSSLEHEPV